MTIPITFAQPLSQLEADLHRIEAPLLNLDTYLRLCAVALNEALDAFWSLPDDRILAILNHYGPQQVEVIFAAHAEKATMLNGLMEARGLNPAARIGAQKQITFNPATGLFEMVPAPVMDVPPLDPVVDPQPESSP